DEIEAKLRDLLFWSYMMRDPFGMVCAVGKGQREDCIREAFSQADEHAIAAFSIINDAVDENRAIMALGGSCCGHLGSIAILGSGRTTISLLTNFDSMRCPRQKFYVGSRRQPRFCATVAGRFTLYVCGGVLAQERSRAHKCITDYTATRSPPCRISPDRCN